MNRASSSRCRTSATLSVEAGWTRPLPSRPTSGTVFVIATFVSVQSRILPLVEKLSDVSQLEYLKKGGAPAWDRGPPKAAFLKFGLGVTEPWVIHPSFPLRGRSARPIPSSKRAPSFPHTGRCGLCWNATHVLFLCKWSTQTVRLRENFRTRLFNALKAPVEHLIVRASSIRESTTRFEVCQGLAAVCAALFAQCGVTGKIR
jgi:hypothetical protein